MTATPLRIVILALSLGLGACANSPVDRAREQLRNGFGEEGLALLAQAARDQPNDIALRKEYMRQRELLITQWLSQADVLLDAGQHEAASAIYRRVQKLDPPNARARARIEQIAADARHRAAVAAAEALVQAGKHQEAQEALRPVLTENPRQRDARRLQRHIDEKLAPPAPGMVTLKSTIGKPFSLELRDVNLRSVFEALQRISGISFVFDKDVRTDQRVSVSLRDASVDEALQAILLTNQLEQKRLNPTTVLLFPGTPQKRREYQELVVKSFYLANADAKQTANMIRAIVKARDVFVDEKLNMVVVKDTASGLRLAERLIATHDLAEPEVMLEVEVLEVSRNRLLDLGLRYPSTVAWSLMGAAGTAGSVTLPEWLGRNSSIVRLAFTDPLFLLSLKQEDGATSVLANPRIRVVNKEKARVHIGDRVPVITTTAAAAGGFISESVNYLDVGLKLDVEPLIYLEDEIGIKIGLEVSSIVREVKGTNSNTLTYQIGTRNANTSLRLRDGETQILAGLISDEDRRTASRVPGLGDLPLIGRLFSSTHETTNRTEVVLLITPRLVRTLARPDARALEFSAGTEAASGVPAMGTIPVPPPASSGLEPMPSTPRPTPVPPAGPQMQPFGGFKPPGQ
jgi:general secretion pathway protein D